MSFSSLSSEFLRQSTAVIALLDGHTRRENTEYGNTKEISPKAIVWVPSKRPSDTHNELLQESCSRKGSLKRLSVSLRPCTLVERDFLLKGFETLLLDIWPKVSDFSGRTGSQT